MSLYNKHRPIQIGEIVGQQNVVKAIKKQSLKNNFSHAYLLSGQFGGGKTSVARILASLMTCKDRKVDVVCGKCKSCISIHEGYCVDVYEMDAASKRGIDDARKIRETAYYAPQELIKKVYIIDECHQLTNDAWNALLKVIEEPPNYVTFIFCTTDHRKVPSTIMSRCQRFNFGQIPNKDMLLRLKEIANEENIKIDDLSSEMIAKVSKGSLRDAINYLEQLATIKDNNISGEDIAEYLGIPEERISYEIVKLIAEQNASELIRKVDEVIRAGVDVKTILYEITDVLRNIFVCKNCGTDSPLLDVLQSDKKAIVDLSERFNVNSLVKIAGSLYKIEKEIGLNINERWILEAALINCISLAKVDVVQKK